MSAETAFHPWYKVIHPTWFRDGGRDKWSEGCRSLATGDSSGKVSLQILLNALANDAMRFKANEKGDVVFFIESTCESEILRRIGDEGEIYGL